MQIYLLALTSTFFVLHHLFSFTFNQSWRARDWHRAPWSVPKNGEASPAAALQPS